MSKIVSPYPPITILITLDRQTGMADMKISEPIPFETVCQAFCGLLLQLTHERITQLTKKPADNATEKPGGSNGPTQS